MQHLTYNHKVWKQIIEDEEKSCELGLEQHQAETSNLPPPSSSTDDIQVIEEEAEEEERQQERDWSDRPKQSSTRNLERRTEDRNHLTIRPSVTSFEIQTHVDTSSLTRSDSVGYSTLKRVTVTLMQFKSSGRQRKTKPRNKRPYYCESILCTFTYGEQWKKGGREGKRK